MREGPPSEPRPIEERLAAIARIVLLGVALASAVLLLYALNRFRGLLDQRAMVVYALAIGGVAFGAWSARRPGSQRVAFALVALATAGTLLLAESTLAWLRRRAFIRAQEQVEAFTGIPLDRRTIPEVVQDLWREDSLTMPAISPAVLTAYTDSAADPRTRFDAPTLPLASVSRRRSVQLCNEDGRYPIFQSDEHGFHNPAGAWDAPKGGLALIGDSFVHGYCVRADSTIDARLRQRWKRTLNLGIGGSGPLAELAILEEFALPTDPAVVVWFYYENDLVDLERERVNPTLVRYLDPSFRQNLIARQEEVDVALDRWVRRVYGGGLAPRPFGEVGLRQLLTLQTIRSLIAELRSTPSDPRAGLPLLRQVIESANARARARESRFVLVFLPSWERYFAPEANAGVDARADLRAIAESLALPLLDLTEVFDATQDRPLLFARRGFSTAHYSAAGYLVVAKAVERGLDSLAISALLDR